MEEGMSISVKKRSGDVEELNIEKIHKMVESACEGLGGVSSSEVEMNSGIQFYDGITTDQIQKVLVDSACNLISLENPNYQFVAARLLLFGLYKQVFGIQWKDGFPSVLDHLMSKEEQRIYDRDLPWAYSDDEWETINSFVDHKRDFLYTYAGLKQVVDK